MKKFAMILLTLFAIGWADGELLEPGTPAPTFVLQSATGGREYLRVWCGESLMKLYQNNVRRRVILSFWSTSCLPCIKEIPELQQFVESHVEDSMKVFLVNLDRESSTELRAYANEQGWTLPILQDPYQNTAGRYGVTSIPTIYVISPMGVVEHSFTGIPEGETADSYLERLIYPETVPSEEGAEEVVESLTVSVTTE